LPPRRALVAEDGDRLIARLAAEVSTIDVPMAWHDNARPQLDLMHLHYMDYLPEVDDATFGALLRDWIAQNRRDRRDCWRDAWHSYSISIRAVVWMSELSERRARLDVATCDLAHRSIVAQLRCLARNVERDIGGNHLIKNLRCLLWGGRYFDGPEAARWHRAGSRLLDTELKRQILADGTHYERSPAYHAQVFADLVDCRRLVSERLRIRLDSKLRKMAGVLADLTHPDGDVSLFNDGTLDMSHQPDVLLDVWADEIGERPAQHPIVRLPDAGYFGLRSADSLCLVDCGSVGPKDLPAHSHGDALAFEWSVDGQRIIVDFGVFEYQAGPRRMESRATRSHNTVTVDDADQCEFWGSFRIGRRPRVLLRECGYDEHQGLVVEGSHDGFRHLTGRPEHRRRFEVRAGEVSVTDAVSGGAGQSVRARLLLHPGVGIERDGSTLLLRQGRTVIDVESTGTFTIEKATWCPSFGVELETQRIVIDYGAAPATGAFTLRRL
jgi:uncharacterized heparinase superfamily protein